MAETPRPISTTIASVHKAALFRSLYWLGFMASDRFIGGFFSFLALSRDSHRSIFRLQFAAPTRCPGSKQGEEDQELYVVTAPAQLPRAVSWDLPQGHGRALLPSPHIQHSASFNRSNPLQKHP